jgi:hypothetical protein
MLEFWIPAQEPFAPHGGLSFFQAVGRKEAGDTNMFLLEIKKDRPAILFV